jgi:hypothetical protein
MDMPIEQQRKLIEQFAATLENVRIVHSQTAYEHMIVECCDAVSCNLMIEMLSKQGFKCTSRKGKLTDHYYLKIETSDPNGELMAFCSATNSHLWMRKPNG